MSRTDYNDLGDSFQETFGKVADSFFKISDKNNKNAIAKKLESKKLELKPKVTNGLIVGVEIDDYDNFTKELLREGGSHEQEMSQHDIERLYNLLCFKFIAGQTDENRKFAPERSWGKLKTALNVWFLDKLGTTRGEGYKIILNDLLHLDGVLAPVIGEALLKYRPIREQEVNKKSVRTKRTEVIEIPREALFFTDLYEKLSVKKSSLEPFYIEKDYPGRSNEEAFIKFLESPKNKNVMWWYKNGDSGSEYFSISYKDPDENREKLFYPDWIVQTRKAVYILDTKGGQTADSKETKYKAEELQRWLKGRKGFCGGIVVLDGVNGWKVNSDKEYSYDPSFTGWESLSLD